MNIAQVSCVFPPYRGGIGTAAFHFARLSHKQGHEVTVFTPAYPGQQKGVSGEHGFKVDRIKPLMRFGNGAFIPGLYNRLRGFDVVHLHYPFFGGSETVWFASLSGSYKIRLIIHYHMDVTDLPPIARILRIPAHLTDMSLFNRAEIITCASFDYIRHGRMREYFDGNQEKFREIPFGVDAQTFVPVAAGDARKRILFVGGLDRAHSFKGVEVLLKAFAALKPEAELVIVGEGDLRPEYERQAQELGIADKVSFTGKTGDRELINHYQQASLLVLPSTSGHEAFGIVLLEAMACGKPVITSAWPGVRTVFTDGEEGFLVEPGSVSDLSAKLAVLLGDDAKRQEMGRRARRLVEAKYDWPAIGDQLERIYAPTRGVM